MTNLHSEHLWRVPMCSQSLVIPGNDDMLTCNTVVFSSDFFIWPLHFNQLDTESKNMYRQETIRTGNTAQINQQCTLHLTHTLLHSVEAAGRASTLDVGDAVLEEVEEVIALIPHLLAYRATVRPQQVAQVHRVDGRASLLVQLSTTGSHTSQGISMRYNT